MPLLVWDSPGERVYETGVDKGVLFLADASAVPWNGLTSVVEHPDKSSIPVYVDGMKIQDLVALGNFSATIKAVTYPDEFLDLEGIQADSPGAYSGDQNLKTFGLSWRTKVGNDLNGDAGYKIHVLYNVTAIPSDSTFSSLSDSFSASEFQWEITAVPVEVDGFRPAAHFIFDTRELTPSALAYLESVIYGGTSSIAHLPAISEMFDFIDGGFLIKIVDNGDGTWTALVANDSFITYVGGDPTNFQINYANVFYSDINTFTVQDTNNYPDST